MQLLWRPGRISKASLLLIAVVSIVFVVVVERNLVMHDQPHLEAKLAASELMAEGMTVIKNYKLSKGITVDGSLDPTFSGLIGLNMSPITSSVGKLSAKQTSLNPNFAAVMVELVSRAGVKKGDTVAVGYSGSFPALNLATSVTCKVMGLHCIIMSSVTASMYGANDPALTWLDMETILLEHGIIDTKSVAGSLGGDMDQAVELPLEGHTIIKNVAERNGVPLILGEDLEETVAARMKLYEELAKGKPIKLYVNVGGSAASVGSHVTKNLFRHGLNKRPPLQPIPVDGTMSLFSKAGLPVINMVNVRRIANEFGLPNVPTPLPEPGQGGIYKDKRYSVWLAGGLFVVLAALLVVAVRFDVRRSSTPRGRGTSTSPPAPTPPSSPEEPVAPVPRDTDDRNDDAMA